MIAIGILLLVAAIAAAAMVATGGNTYAQATFGALRIENTTAFFFFAGALATIVLLVGAWFVVRGYVRWRERGRELRQLRERVEVPEQAQSEDRDLVGADEPPSSRRRTRLGHVPTQASSTPESQPADPRPSGYVSSEYPSEASDDEGVARPSRYGRSGRYRAGADSGKDDPATRSDSSSISA